MTRAATSNENMQLWRKLAAPRCCICAFALRNREQMLLRIGKVRKRRRESASEKRAKERAQKQNGSG